MDIENIDEVNTCGNILECAVALRVKVTQETANMNLEPLDKTLPKSLALLIAMAKSNQVNENNIIEIEL